MQKEIINVDEKAGVFRVTTQDERWYTKLVFDKSSLLPTITWRPSVTWIGESYPKGIGFYKWLADKGWDESQALKTAAGDKGSKVHKAIERLIDGQEVKATDKILNKSTGQEEELTVEEWECLMGFMQWVEAYKPKFLKKEIVVESEQYNYAGTVDCIAEIKGEVYILDWKTSQYLWPHMEIQLAAYRQAIREMFPKVTHDYRLAVVQVGYKKNRVKIDGSQTLYKHTEIPDQFELFKSTYGIWQKEHGHEKPKQRDYPMTLKIAIPEEAPKAEEEKPSSKKEAEVSQEMPPKAPKASKPSSKKQ